MESVCHPRSGDPGRKRVPFSQLFLSLSRACLGKMIVFSIKLVQFKRRFTYRGRGACGVEQRAVGACENHISISLSNFSLCLSRACLGKMIVFNFDAKWHRRIHAVFAPGADLKTESSDILAFGNLERDYDGKLQTRFLYPAERSSASKWTW